MLETAALEKIGFLKDLSTDELGCILEACEPRRFDKGAIIIDEGVRGTGLYMIETGTADVLKARAGQPQLIAKLRKGDHFGEMSLLRDSPTSATVRAATDVQGQFIPRDTFLTLLNDHPTIGKKVLWSFADSLSDRLVKIEKDYARTLRRRNRFATWTHFGSLMWLVTRMMWSYSRVWFRKLIRWPHKPEALGRIHRTNARRFKDTAFKLKGANVKLGQLASLQVHLMPAEYIDEFRDMRDQVSPTAYPMVVGRLQEEYGMSPLEVFQEFDKMPLAAASMGQVHAATLPSGERVAVKMLHPGLERGVDVDLWVMRKLLGFFSMFTKKLDLRELYRQSEGPMRKELDLIHEGKATEEIGREMAPLGVHVPKVHWRYSTPRILVTEFIEGVTIDNLEQIDAWGVDRKKLMQDYLRAFFHQAFDGGFFHCDPHPGNAFCTPEGKLVLIDFGMVKRLPDNVRGGLLMEALGGFFNNAKLYADGVITRGMIDESERGKLETLAGEAFSDPDVRAQLFDHDAKKDGDMKRLFGKIGEVLDQFDTFKMPTDELMFLRALGIVITVVREVCPETSMQQLAMPVVMPIFTKFMMTHPQYASIPRAAKTTTAS